MKIILRNRSIIPACDVPLELYEKMVRDTADIDGVGAYKIGFELGLRYSLSTVVELTRKYTNKPVIYDHQKAGTDIPETGKSFAKIMKDCGVNAVIFLPQAGPETQRAWIEAAQEQDIGVIVGGLMTHQKYLRSEGGYLADEAILEMYLNAAAAGVSDFVVPGNRPEDIKRIKEALEQRGQLSRNNTYNDSPTFYSPGFVAQGGMISDVTTIAGKSWHAIVGRGMYQTEDIRKAALEYVSLL